MPDVFMPRLSDTMTEGVIRSWVKHEGDTVEHGDVIAEIETDKAVMDLECYESGELTQIVAPEGSTVPVGQTIAVIDGEPAEAAPTSAPATAEAVPEAPPPPTTAEPASAPAAAAAPVSAEQSKVRATPLVRQLAREHAINLTTVAGSGPSGRIVRADLDTLLTEQPAAAGSSAPAPEPEPTTAPAPPVVSTPAATDEQVPLSPIRKITAERLTQSAAAPSFHLTVAVDAGPLLDLRADLNRQVFTGDIRCSVTDLLVRAVAVNLAAHREVNASWGGNTILRHAQVNVGIAVALDEGLIVPVIRDADRKGIAEIAAEAHALAGRARDGRLTPDEYSGGTFTISNLGTFGIEHFTAVINPPEAAILAIGAAREEPVVRDGDIVTAPIMRMTLTSDHRVLDGAVSASFLHDLVQILGRPLRILG